MSSKKGEVMRTMTIVLPVSDESFGRWLEENNASVGITCSLGNYHVTVNHHSLTAFKEEGDVSVNRSNDVRVSAYGKTFAETLHRALTVKVKP